MECTILKDVFVGLVTGVAASATYEWLMAMRKSRTLRNQFGKLQGHYAECREMLGQRSIKLAEQSQSHTVVGQSSTLWRQILKASGFGTVNFSCAKRLE